MGRDGMLRPSNTAVRGAGAGSVANAVDLIQQGVSWLENGQHCSAGVFEDVIIPLCVQWYGTAIWRKS